MSDLGVVHQCTGDLFTITPQTPPILLLLPFTCLFIPSIASFILFRYLFVFVSSLVVYVVHVCVSLCLKKNVFFGKTKQNTPFIFSLFTAVD